MRNHTTMGAVKLLLIAVTYLLICSPCQLAKAQQQPESEELFWLSEARGHYAASEFEKAIVLLEKAYNATRQPRFLFNLAANHHGLGNCALARNYYEQYLPHAEQGAQRHRVTLALKNLREHCGKKKQEEPTAEPSLPDRSFEAAEPQSPPFFRNPTGETPWAPQSPSPLFESIRSDYDVSMPAWQRTTAISLIGSGAGAGLAAAIFYLQRERARDDVNAQRNTVTAQGDDEPRPVWDEARENDREGDVLPYNRLMWALTATSGLLLASGTSLLIIEFDTNSSVMMSSAGYPGVSFKRSF